MTPDTLQFFKEFFNEIWHIFTSVTIPGTNITASMALIGFFGIEVISAFIHKVMDSGSPASIRSIERTEKFINSRTDYFKKRYERIKEGD